jgi:PAS domain S-box-containing protein/diguanylate cyclase (GGDEF)-like protein
MLQLSGTVLGLMIDGAPEGILVCDARQPDHPVVYANPAFERFSGYARGELLGRNPRLLHGKDSEQEGSRRLRDCIARGEGGRATLRNYRKDGSLLWAEVQLLPLRDAGGELSHFVAYYRDVSDRIKSQERPAEGPPASLREDRVSGLLLRSWFEVLMVRDWATAQREERPLTLVLFHIDSLDRYGETFGPAAADAVVRRVARLISLSFRRGIDVVGRWDTACVAVLAGPVLPEGIAAYVQTVVQRVADLRIHHPHAVGQKFITVSAGVATRVPSREDPDSSVLVREAESALRQAQG